MVRQFTCKRCTEIRRFSSHVAYMQHLEAKHGYPKPAQRIKKQPTTCLQVDKNE